MAEPIAGRPLPRATPARVAWSAVGMVLVAAAAVWGAGDKVQRLDGTFVATMVASVLGGLGMALAFTAYARTARRRRVARSRRIGAGSYALTFWVLLAFVVLTPGVAGVAVVGFCVGLWLFLLVALVTGLGGRSRSYRERW